MAKRKIDDWQADEYLLELQLGFMFDELYRLGKSALKKIGIEMTVLEDDPETGTTYEIYVERSGRISVLWVFGEWKPMNFGWYWRVGAGEEPDEYNYPYLMYLHSYISEIHAKAMKKK